MFCIKQITNQRFVFKIHSSRLRKAKWNLELSLENARKNDELISLADSQVIRWIDEINGYEKGDILAENIKKELKSLKSNPNDIKNRRRVRELYEHQDNLLFKRDYMCLIIDREKDYYRAVKGFTINDVRYVRLLGTNGGIKNSTIVFVSDKVADEIRKRIDNGRNKEKKYVTAKLEAYKALACSASTPVSVPNGILVVPDVETTFSSDITYITDECEGEPIMEDIKDYSITLNASDGFGLMLPSLAQRWSDELGLDYLVSGLNSRFSYMKGMIYTFDFFEFFRQKANRDDYIIKDIWGDERDLRNVELILTASMVKLWDAYDSLEDYLNNSLLNNYTFGVTKVCPDTLENVHALNYQFIQGFNLNDDDIDELIAPTVNQIKDVLGGDVNKTIIFLKGNALKVEDAFNLKNDIAKALMIDKRMINDPYIKSSVYRFIKNRINEAKVGVLDVHGNYSIVSGDPVTLCQSVFGLKVTGLLKEGEIYNKYWADTNATELCCFRAPMSTKENIRVVKPIRSNEALYWYQYMRTCTIFNSWDTAMIALNGMDFDGDLVMLTDNEVLLRRALRLPALVCVQRKAEKIIPTDADFIRSNIESFGNEIGATTNKITAMYDVQSQFDEDSIEYKILEYRIRAGQLYQQNCIDKAKGIISKPMPREWYDRMAIAKIDDDSKRELYYSLVADKKPYFMKNIYPTLMAEYKKYMKSINRKANRTFDTALESMDINDYKQSEMLYFAEMLAPVLDNDCVMNRICRKVEESFLGWDKELQSNKNCCENIALNSGITDFDYRIMKYGVEYEKPIYRLIKREYEDYKNYLSNRALLSKTSIDEVGLLEQTFMLNRAFDIKCHSICSFDRLLCDIALDLCYGENINKSFVWGVCRETIINNLLEKNDCLINIPIADENGEIEFSGERFTMKQVKLEVNDGIYF